MRKNKLFNFSLLIIAFFIILAIVKHNLPYLKTLGIIKEEKLQKNDISNGVNNSADSQELQIDVKNPNFVVGAVNEIASSLLENPNVREIIKTSINNAITQRSAEAFDPINSGFVKTELNSGQGAVAECGDKATLRIQYSEQEINNSIQNPSSKKLLLEKTIIIGSGTINQKLENAVIKMKEKSKEQIIFSNLEGIIIDQGSGIDRIAKVNSVDLELTNLTKRNSHKQIEPYFRESAISLGYIYCADKAKFKITIKDIENKIIYENNSLNFTIGDEQTPVEISRALVGKKSDGLELMFISPPSLLQDANGNPWKILPQNIGSSDKNYIFILKKHNE